jgi:organic hydroperoxide reductase OsmC/OhrA
MSARARVFEYAVAIDTAWDATSDRGGTPLPGAEREAWTPEHLLIAGLGRCTLTSLKFHCDRAGLDLTSRARARGTVTRRESDGRFALVEAQVALDVELSPLPEAEALAALLGKAERDCFVGASLSARPTYRWTVNGEAQ